MFNFQLHATLYMYTSKIKLTLHWLLIIVAFYVFWALAYLVLAKFAMTEISRFSYVTEKSAWSQITASDIFWYAMFIFGIAISIFVIKKAMQYAPNPKIAALIYAVLIILSVGVLMAELLKTDKFVSAIPHLVINAVLLIPIVARFFKKDLPYYEEEEDEEETQDYSESSI